MKGIVFTEFLEMVEKSHGYAMVDKLISSNNLESEGIYTSIGTYPHSEMVMLVSSLSKETETPIPRLLYVFGTYLFDTFTTNYREFFDACGNAFDFFDSIENYIHVQVLKLYPDAELPKFTTIDKDENVFKMIYSSDRKMADFARGLIERSLDYYNENAEVSMEKISEDGKEVLFVITRKNERKVLS